MSSLLRSPDILSESHVGFCFVLGQLHPPTKELKNSLIHHRPSLPHRLEAINSGSRWRTMFSNVLDGTAAMPTHFVLLIPSSCELPVRYGHF